MNRKFRLAVPLLALLVWACSGGAVDQCRGNAECPEGQYCGENGACTLDCRGDADCFESTCNSLGQCVGPETDPGGDLASKRRWVDATGQVIEGAFSVGPLVVFFQDERGFIWRIDPSTAQVSVAGSVPVGDFLAFESSDCTGRPFLLANRFDPPRYTFVRDFETDVIRVRGDTQQVVQVMRCSVQAPDGCTVVPSGGPDQGMCDGPHMALDARETLPEPPAVRPMLDITPPLHLE